MKVKFPTDQFRPALGSCCCLMDGLLTMLKKPQNCPISDFFDLTPKYFLVFLHYTDLEPPSTGPVSPSTNQYRSILTQYHQLSTCTNLYCCCLGITDSCTVYPGSCYLNNCVTAAGSKKAGQVHQRLVPPLAWCRGGQKGGQHEGERDNKWGEPSKLLDIILGESCCD